MWNVTNSKMIGSLQYTPDPKVFQNNFYATKGIDNEYKRSLDKIRK